MSTFFHGAIASAYFRAFSPEKAVELFQAGNFHFAELCHEHAEEMIRRAKNNGETALKTGNSFRLFLKDRDFSVPQGHLSFLPGSQGGILKEGFVDILKKDLELFCGIGIENAVIHLSASPEPDAQKRHEKVLKILADLAEFLKGTDLCICIENLYENCDTMSADEILTYIDEVNSEQLGICLDTGHLHLANAQGKTAQSQREFIVKAGRRLKALHIANNNGICDLHLLPFNCSHGIHWDEVVRALIDVGYNGIFNLEISGEHSSVTCPDKVREIKLVYIRKLLDYMLSEEFISRK